MGAHFKPFKVWSEKRRVRSSLQEKKTHCYLVQEPKNAAENPTTERGAASHCEQSEAISTSLGGDCFVGKNRLLAMTPFISALVPELRSGTQAAGSAVKTAFRLRF